MRLHYILRPEEVDITAIRAQGAGGQNVNKVSSAAHLRFHIADSSLPDELKARLLALGDQRISKDGTVVIKAQTFRSLDQNRAEALRRLEALLADAAQLQKKRRPTRPGRAAVERRLQGKTRRSMLKAGRKAGDD